LVQPSLRDVVIFHFRYRELKPTAKLNRRYAAKTYADTDETSLWHREVGYDSNDYHH
jgi:hypothetical protein